MKNIQTEITINATPSKVWNVLMDFPRHEEWNPFMQIEGEAKVGRRLKNTMHLEGQKPQVFRPEILEVVPEKTFRWEGHLFFKGLFDGEHYFQLEPLEGNSTRLVHGENFRGLLVAPLIKMIGKQTQKAFSKMNEALKARCEAI